MCVWVPQVCLCVCAAHGRSRSSEQPPSLIFPDRWRPLLRPTFFCSLAQGLGPPSLWSTLVHQLQSRGGGGDMLLPLGLKGRPGCRGPSHPHASHRPCCSPHLKPRFNRRSPAQGFAQRTYEPAAFPGAQWSVVQWCRGLCIVWRRRIVLVFLYVHSKVLVKVSFTV